MRRKLIMSAIMVSILALTGVAFAGWRNGKWNPEQMKKFAEWRIDNALDEVDATKEQRAVVDAEKDGLFAEAEATIERRDDVKALFVQAWSSEKPDADALHKAVDNRVDEWRALAHRAVDSGLKIHGTLQPEQRKALAEKFGQSCSGH
jgi:Spy/CpxP family protein refolding chaperone